MKKFILSAAAVAGIAMGGVAHADLIDGVGNTISRIFGVPYDARPTASVPIGTVYTDPNGRRIQVDAAGRHVPLDQYGTYRDQYGRTVHLGANNQPVYIEQNGQLVPYGGTSGAYAMGPSSDQDGDGVTDRYDRSPYDARYR